MKINAKWLAKERACKEGKAWFRAKYGKKSANAEDVLRALLDIPTDTDLGLFRCGAWAMWLVNRTVNARALVDIVVPALRRTAPRKPFDTRYLLSMIETCSGWINQGMAWQRKRLEELRITASNLNDYASDRATTLWTYRVEQVIAAMQGRLPDIWELGKLVWGVELDHWLYSPHPSGRMKAYRRLAKLLKE